MIAPEKLAALKSYAHFKAGYLHVYQSRESIRAEIDPEGTRTWHDGTLISEEEWAVLLDLIKAEHAKHLDLLKSVNLA